MIEHICKNCGRTYPRYNTMTTICGVCAYNRYTKPRKPIKKRGKKSYEYEAWRNEVAVPYLNEKYGYKCVDCGATEALDVDHIKKRGSHPELKMEVTNVVYRCRPCHIKVT